VVQPAEQRTRNALAVDCNDECILNRFVPKEGERLVLFPRRCWCGSVVEQRTRNAQVGGSSPPTSSIIGLPLQGKPISSFVRLSEKNFFGVCVYRDPFRCDYSVSPDVHDSFTKYTRYTF
jgi:hypothetical protein